MKKKISKLIKNFLSTDRDHREHVEPDHSIAVDVREEYANAFRTESYIDFWTRVLALNNGDSSTHFPVETTTAARLPSYRLFAEHLLDPDQPTVSRILASAHNTPSERPLLSDYFAETANASLLCGLLLKEIDRARVKHRPFKIILQSIENAQFTLKTHFQSTLTCFIDFSDYSNPFVSSAPSPCRVRVIQAGLLELLKRLELGRHETRARLRHINKLKHSSAIFLVALTASLSVIVVTHGVALLVAAPSLLVASVQLASTRKLAKTACQLDTAAKGTYTLNRDMETISRLVARLNHELEYMSSTIKFWLERGDHRLQAIGEVARQLKKSYSCFSQQLDELEEHLYLCFMTINRARNLVLKEILDPGQPAKAPYI